MQAARSGAKAQPITSRTATYAQFECVMDALLKMTELIDNQGTRKRMCQSLAALQEDRSKDSRSFGGRGSRKLLLVQ
jgi:hypothetical protein